MAAFFGVGIEARSGSQHHRGTVVAEIGEQPLAELVAIVDGQVNDGVERALRHRAEAARNLVDTLDDDITAGHILALHGIKILLRRVDGGLGENLTKRRRRQPSLSQTHGNGVDLAVAGNHAAHAGTASAITLRNGVVTLKCL